MMHRPTGLVVAFIVAVAGLVAACSDDEGVGRAGSAELDASSTQDVQSDASGSPADGGGEASVDGAPLDASRDALLDEPLDDSGSDGASDGASLEAGAATDAADATVDADDGSMARAVQFSAMGDKFELNRATDGLATQQAVRQPIKESSEQAEQVANNVRTQQREERQQSVAQGR